MPTQPDNTYYIQLLNPDGSNNGNPVPTQNYGIEDIEFELNNLAADTWTFTIGGRALDAATVWPYGQLMAILDANKNRVAFGRIEPWKRDGSGPAQNHFGRLIGPWWYLANKVYEQTFRLNNNFGPDGQPNYYTATTPRVILNILYDAALAGGFYSATTGQQIRDAVNWAIGLGAPITVGTVDPATLPFSDPQKGILCADVIKQMFRKEPDFIVDWDYSTTPFPTIHFRKQASFKPINIDLTNNTVREAVHVLERPDWQRSYVRIMYDQQDQINGGNYLAIATDLYPPAPPASLSPAQLIEYKFRGVDLYADLTGLNISNSSQTAQFASMPFNLNDLGTWQRWNPDLVPDGSGKTGIVGQVFIETGADSNYPAPALATVDEFDNQGKPVALDLSCIYEVVDGAWADWIPGVNAQRVRATCYITTIDRSGKKETKPSHHDMTVVSLNTGGISKSYTATATNITQYPEPVPVGLAKAMWTSWQNLAIEGGFTNVEAVVGSTQKITRSNTLNFLTNSPGIAGAPDWRNVNALIQRISGSFAKGTTRVEFGAPLRITGNDLIDAIRATRFRVTTIDISYFFGGQSGGGSTAVKMSRKTHARHSSHGGTHKRFDVVSEKPQPVAGTDPSIQHDGSIGTSQWSAPNTTPQNGPTVIINPANAKGGDGKWHPLNVQEVKVMQLQPDGSCKQRTQIFLCSEVYKGNGDPN
jgi:hypothetical protein